MNRWFRFFLGTPQRFLRTFIVVGLVVVVLNPGLLALAVNRFLEEINPILGPLLTIGIIYAGIMVILRKRK